MPVEFNANTQNHQQEGLFVPSYLTGKNSRLPTSNMKPMSSDVDFSKSPFDKVQLTKLLIDTLHEMGYAETAISLQQESGGIEVESGAVQRLFAAIKQGKFEHIDLEMLLSLPLKRGNLKTYISERNSNHPSSQGSNVESETTAMNEDDEDAMRIDNIIVKNADWNRFFSTMQKELTVLETLVQSMASFDVKALTSLLDTVEILVLINREVFLELMFDQQDSSLAVFFLRTVFRKFIQLWESLLMYQESSYALTPDALLKQMTSVLTCPFDSAELSDVWPRNAEKSRQLLIRSISKYIDPNDLVPRGRLLTLLSQAIKYQNSQDVLNFECEEDENMAANSSRRYNLLQDNSSTSHRISFTAEKKLAQNADEIWYLEFSPDGKYLASASADSLTDRKVLIYDVENDFQVYKVLGGNEQCVLYLSFSPDSKYLISCPFNEEAKIYDIHKKGEPTSINQEFEGAIIAEIIQPYDSFKICEGEGISNSTSPRIWCCDWFHTERNRGRFALGSPDRDVIIYEIASRSVLCKLSQVLNSNNTSATEPFPRVHDLKITYDDKYLIIMAHEFFVDTYDVSNLPPVRHDDNSLSEPAIDKSGFHLFKVSRLSVGKRMTCLTIPQVKHQYEDQSSLILINVQPHELQLWDFKEQILIQKYYGQRQLQFIIRSCFGYDNKLVASGSEDGKIYIWDRYHGNIISVLHGHESERPSSSARSSTKTFGRNCNIVVWNPANKNIFASGGDDGLIKIWKVVRG
ncbi:LANO_0G01024g1_1 [Lachancea nothofagi CBS 11611]|uniref:LANO_0G01024g1_1 n=1 Tax=Lachancea nothofagi CBS 11611 TaxID=1266666 RepID=A0A1G4KEX9_9SACH|nr:LANO_0G01024g1_1 [Lachancea nothofagi CBS 11611]